MIDSLRVLDVSHYQGAIDFTAVKSDAVAGVICNAAEGVSWRDPMFDRNWAGVKDAGLARGCYFFARLEWNSPINEAAWFLTCVPHVEPGDLVAYDIETGPNDGSDLSARALVWLTHVEDVLQVTPLLYANLSYVQTRLRDPALARFPLWLADYTNVCPPRAGVWDSVALWQHTNIAQCPGIVGNVDESLIARDLAGLRQLGKPPAPHKIVLLVDMMLRSAPEASHVYWPVQMCYKGATLDVVGGPESGWIEVRAGNRTGWLLEKNIKYLL